jgi:hypothetical protein
MTYKPENTGSVRMYLKQRDAEEIIRDAKRESGRIAVSRQWLADYNSRPRKSGFNWSPTIKVTTPKECTTNDQGTEAQAIEVDHEKGVGDPSGETRDGAGSIPFGDSDDGAEPVPFGNGDVPF